MSLQNLAMLFLESDEKHRSIVNDYRGAALDRALEAFTADYKKRKTSAIYTLSLDIDALEAKVDKASEYHPDDASISEACSMLKNQDISFDAIRRIAKSFKGNQTALSLLSASCRPEYKSFFEAYMFDTAECFGTIRAQLDSVSKSDNYNAIPSAVSEIRFWLKKLAEKEDIDASMGSTIEKLRIINMAQHIGVDPDEII